MLNMVVHKITTKLKRFSTVTNKRQSVNTNLLYVILIKAKKYGTNLLKPIFDVPSAVNTRKEHLYDLMSCTFTDKYRNFRRICY